MVAAQARRRSQYKSLTPNTPPARIFSNSRRRSSSGRLFTDGDAIASPAEPDSQKVYLRDRFKARCLERAVKARAKAIRGKRYSDQRSSDDIIMDYDDDEAENEEDIMQDEVLVFQLRVITSSFVTELFLSVFPSFFLL
jgi:hypothetical protein